MKQRPAKRAREEGRRKRGKAGRHEGREGRREAEVKGNGVQVGTGKGKVESVSEVRVQCLHPTKLALHYPFLPTAP